MTPRASLIALFALGAVPAAIAAFHPAAIAVAATVNVLVLAAAVADLVLTPSPRVVDLRRQVSEVLGVGVENTVTIAATNRSRRDLRVELCDEPPRPSRTAGMPLVLDLPPWKEREGEYDVVPRRRGANRFAAVHVRYRSVLGLWTRMEQRPLETAVRIYPDVRAVSRFDLMAVRNRLDDIGLTFRRLRGRGGEFERLREYRREDEPRSIDWKATAKYDQLISREFTVERNQNVFILLDGGRSMRNESDGISHFDRALNAAIILSYVALGQGDNVGLMAFSNRIERWVTPVRGKAGIRSIVRQMFDLEPRLEASDYALACEEVVRRQRKRALVILISHTLDEQHLVTLSTYVRTLTASHLLLCVLLRDVSLSALANSMPDADLEAFHVAAAAELISSQARRLAILRDAGVLVLETLPGELSTGLINRYVDLKARHLL